MDRVVFQGTGKRYGKLWALRNLNTEFQAGEVVMVIGPNGSGKTTMIKCLLGLVRPTEGSVKVNGETIGRNPVYRERIGYMPQISQFPAALSIGQLLEMMRDVRGMDHVQANDPLIEQFGLHKQLDKRLSALSGGTRQKVSAVLALRTRPDVLVMDEPTAGLDPISAGMVLERARRMRDDGGTVIITSHLMEEVEALADRVAYLQDGELKFLATVKEILNTTRESRLVRAIPAMLQNKAHPTLNE